MRSMRQLLRQPLKSISGCLLICLAVAVLCVCLGQSMAAQRVEEGLENNYVTAAIPTTKYQKGTDAEGRAIILNEFPQEVVDWIQQTAAEHPDIVEALDSRGLASAYIPELVPDNPVGSLTTKRYSVEAEYELAVSPFNAPYDQAMLVITLQEVVDPLMLEDSSVQTLLIGTIDQVLGLSEGYADPTGYTAKLTLNLPDMESLNALELEPGAQYIVYGRAYSDLDWLLRCQIFTDTRVMYTVGLELDYIDLEAVISHSERNIDAYRAMNPEEYNVAYLAYERPGTDKVIQEAYQLTNLDMEKLHTITLTLESSGAEGYENPTIARLSGSPEQFLAENSAWNETLSDIAINAQSFPVVGTDNLLSVASFAQENARITEGRNFTEEEITNGANVCVLSQTLAEQNGLSVGDTITLNYYDIDYDSPYQEFVSEGFGIVNPTAYYFDSHTPFADKGVTCTIVGLYEQDVTWERPTENLYAFTHNTIFVPKNSVTGMTDYANQGFFLSLVLVNGKLDEFQALAEQAGQSGLFEYYDQGYEAVHDSIHDYTAVANRAVLIGLGVYCIILLLYLILFPGFQAPVLNTMSSLGATRREKRRHIVTSSLGILIPGTIIGAALALASWDRIVSGLAETAGVTLDLKLNVSDIAVIAGAQLLLSTLLMYLTALLLCSRENLMDRQESLFTRIKSSRKGAFNGWIVCLFAAVIAIVLCALNAANEAEQRDFEEAYAAAPVRLTVVDYREKEKEDLYIDQAVVTVFTNEHMQFMSIAKYVTDVQMVKTNPIRYINGENTEYQLVGITSFYVAPELTDEYSAEVNWVEGYSEADLASKEALCIVPEGVTADYQPSVEGQQLHMEFGYIGPLDKCIIEYEETYTVIGTYTTTAQVSNIYTTFEAADRSHGSVEGDGVTNVSALLVDNSLLEELRERASRIFVEFGATELPKNKVPYALDINDDALIQLETTLENSMRVNRLCTMLVFLLTAGTGFFLGFLMVRQRKREIILMRTLGKPNSHIYRDFALEQMLWVLIGIAAGGALFRWTPLGQLALFGLIYFLGLSAALVLFLRSRLLTTVKEEN